MCARGEGKKNWREIPARLIPEREREREREMLQEVLLSLAGHPGDLIGGGRGGDKGAGGGAFSVDEDMPFLEPAEKDMLKRVARLGSLYSSLESFCESYRSLHAGRGLSLFFLPPCFACICLLSLVALSLSLA